MKFLVIAQNLKVSGASEGIVSRSFLAKLRMAYPESIIDVLYLKNHYSEDQLHLLPVDSIQSHVINLKPPFVIKWLNRISWRLFHISLYDRFVHKSYGSYISKIDHEQYNHIFIRSSGLNHETLLGGRDLPILKKAIINFHDPYPFFWYQGSHHELSGVELFRLKTMYKVIQQAKGCISTAQLMSNDLEFLYGSRKKFYTIPHQFSPSVFDLSDIQQVQLKQKKLTIAYHGSIQFGRKINTLLDAYAALVNENATIKEETEFVLRLGGGDVNALQDNYKECSNIVILPTLNFSNSAYEQAYIADINVILENGPLYCNILVGKAPFLASIHKPVFCISPERSELRQIIKDSQLIANGGDIGDVKVKLEVLIEKRLVSNEPVYCFGDYFSDEHFKKKLNEVLFQKSF
ncbi:glycosyltransferase family 1 protein [Flavobacterium sp. 120]|uniref:glycosyltransferase family 1 protein n=1 Tax=Flavobacterium sp. 120 TaxID=2135626 RepID=UPI000EADA02D|nr:glycosyltransferase family 1 protein [Flavobacterium sp. 120]RKS13354.1 hypothetical protein C8C87_0564 [Flavobacterium sp. 120]